MWRGQVAMARNMRPAKSILPSTAVTVSEHLVLRRRREFNCFDFDYEVDLSK